MLVFCLSCIIVLVQVAHLDAETQPPTTSPSPTSALIAPPPTRLYLCFTLVALVWAGLYNPPTHLLLALRLERLIAPPQLHQFGLRGGVVGLDCPQCRLRVQRGLTLNQSRKETVARQGGCRGGVMCPSLTEQTSPTIIRKAVCLCVRSRKR